MIFASASLKTAMVAPIRTLYARVDLLDKDERLVARIEGVATDGSMSCDGERDVEREFSLTLRNDSGDYTWSPGALIWLDKRVQLWIGLETSTDVEYVSLGVFLLSEMNVTSGADGTRVAEMRGGDKWKLFDGQPLGLFTYTTIIHKENAQKVKTKISDAIRLLAEAGGEKKFIFDDCTSLVPYDLTYQVGDHRGRAMRELADVPTWRLRYDNLGHLRFYPKIKDLTRVAPVAVFSKKDPATQYAGAQRIFGGGTVNKVIAIGGSSQTATVSDIAVHDDPESPFSTVNIGERIYVHNNGSPDSLILTKEDAKKRALYELQQRLGYSELQHIRLRMNFLLEVGDVIRIVDDWTGTDDLYEVTRFSLSFRPGELMMVEAKRIRKVLIS